MVNMKQQQYAEQFDKFYADEWDLSMAYVPSDFIKKFDMDRHLARYYLMKMVYEKKIFRIKYTNKTFYIKYDDKLLDKFKEYTWMGVQITK